MVDFAAAKEFSTVATDTFEIWIQIGATEGIWFTYGATAFGDGGFVTVGAENSFGNSGDMEYIDGAGVKPVSGNEINVTTTPPSPGETKTWTFQAKGTSRATVTNYAELVSNLFAGKNIASAVVTITP